MIILDIWRIKVNTKSLAPLRNNYKTIQSLPGWLWPFTEQYNKEDYQCNILCLAFRMNMETLSLINVELRALRFDCLEPLSKLIWNIDLIRGWFSGVVEQYPSNVRKNTAMDQQSDNWWIVIVINAWNYWMSLAIMSFIALWGQRNFFQMSRGGQ